MAVAAHPQTDRLRSVIAGSAEAEPWAGRVYRCVELAWARPEYLVSGEGTRRHGGRWMAPGITEVVHAASTEALALKESRGVYASYGITKPRVNPRVSVELEVKLSRVWNLACAGESLAPYMIEELLVENWRALNDRGQESLGQALGRLGWESGFEGLLVPSARDRRGRNLIWFPRALAAGSTVEISGRTDLEQWIAE